MARPLSCPAIMRAIQPLFIAAVLFVSFVDGRQVKGLDIEEARSFVKDIFSAMTTQEAAVAIAAAAPQSDDGGMTARLTAIFPVANKLTEDIRTKYGFEGSLQDAMQAAGQAGEIAKDKKLFDEIQGITEILAGEGAPDRIGRVAELDVLADSFLALDAEGRLEAVRKAQVVLDRLDDTVAGLEDSTAGAPTYLETMQGIIAQGNDFVIDKIVEVIFLLGSETDKFVEASIVDNIVETVTDKVVKDYMGARSTNVTRKELHIRLNVLSEFLGVDDHARVEERVEAARRALADDAVGKVEL